MPMYSEVISNAELLAEILLSMKELQKVVKDIKESTDKLAVDIAEIKESLSKSSPQDTEKEEGSCTAYDY